MMNLSAQAKSLILSKNAGREIILRFPDGGINDIGSENIVSESFELTQSVCDESRLVLGGAEAAQMTIRIIDINAELGGRRVKAYLRQKYASNALVPSNSLVPSQSLHPGEHIEAAEHCLFTGIIASAKKQKNRRIKEIIAYDDMYLYSKMRFTAESLSMYIGMNTYTNREFLTELFDMKELSFDPDTDQTASFNHLPYLYLDNEPLYKVLGEKGASLQEFLRAYAELNAAFALFRGDGSMQIKSLSKYTDQQHTATEQRNIDEIIPSYFSLSDFAYGSSTSGSWYTSDNLILRLCSDPGSLVTNFWTQNGVNYLFNSLLSYRPFRAEIASRWWLEPGDRVKIMTGYENDIEYVDSFILSRTIRGINGMRVIIEAKGTEYIGNEEVAQDESV